MRTPPAAAVVEVSAAWAVPSPAKEASAPAASAAVAAAAMRGLRKCMNCLRGVGGASKKFRWEK